MGYTPKHAKPVSLNTTTAAHPRYALSALSGPRGRHAAPAGVIRQDGGTAVPGLRAA